MAKKLYGKSIMINNPPLELRKRIEEEAKRQNRSMNNFLIVVLTRVFFNSKSNALHFASREEDAAHAAQEGA
jgi:hypothetical protein